MSLRTRIAAVAGIAVAITVLVAAATIYVAVRSSLRGEVDQTLVERAEGVGPRFGRAWDRGLGPRGPLELRSDAGPFGGATGIAQFVLRDGTVLVAPGASEVVPVTAAVRALAASGAGQRFDDLHVRRTHLRILTVATPFGALQVARPLTEVDRQLSRILAILAVVAAAGVALAAGLGAVVARAALAPVRRVTHRMERLAADPDVSERLDVEGDDELARLARSFNTTLDALERSVAAQRQLVADASHELRTPIASLRANIQVLQDADRLAPEDRAELRDDIVRELDELTALVSDVVRLARRPRAEDVVDDVRLDLVAAAVVERAQRRAGRAVTIRPRLEPTVVAGEPETIARAVTNLVDNAVKWTPAGGDVDVTLEDGVLTVRDRGPGFAPEDLPRVFERFYRSDRARGMPGSGLGLAIVRQAAEAHGGTTEAANAPDGGAVLRVSFGPAAPVADGDAGQLWASPAGDR